MARPGKLVRGRAFKPGQLSFVHNNRRGLRKALVCAVESVPISVLVLVMRCFLCHYWKLNETIQYINQ